jgi:hypothetical protein
MALVGTGNLENVGLDGLAEFQRELIASAPAKAAPVPRRAASSSVESISSRSDYVTTFTSQ